MGNMEKKSRILYIKRLLEEQTDEQHPLTIAEITAHLKQAGFSCGRKSVKHDIDLLIESGEDVVCNKGRVLEYFVGDRVFELPELKLLVDAIQAARFVPPNKTKALIKKLTAFASVHQATELNRHLHIDKYPKSTNDRVLHTVDLLYTAINTQRKVTFKYYEYDNRKLRVYKHNGQVYTFSPYCLFWNSDNYYALGHSDSHGKVVKFRVDRIAGPKLSELAAVPMPDGFDMATYTKSVFLMYDGDMQDVTLKCENGLMKSVVDRFGEDVQTEVLDKEHFCAHIRVAATPTFYGWVAGFGGKMTIAAPQDVVEHFLALVRSITSEPW